MNGINPSASILVACAERDAVTLEWSCCPDSDFSSYMLYRSETFAIESNLSSADLVAVIPNRDSLNCIDTGFDPDRISYYAVQTVDNSQLASWSNEIAVAVQVSSHEAPLSCGSIQGRAGVSLCVGEDVTVTGIVTAGVSEYSTGTDHSQGQYAVIQDVGGGEWSGLVLFSSEGILRDVERGDSVVVFGHVIEYDMQGNWEESLTEVVVQSVLYRDAGHGIPAACTLSTSEVALEGWEGVLVSVMNTTVTNSNLGYNELYIDDGSGEARMDDMGIRGFSVSNGDHFARVTGVVFYSFGNYKIEPRDESDIIK